MAKKMKEATSGVKAKKMRETTARAKAWKCVRYDDKNGHRTKFNKTKFPNELMRELYYFGVKYVEQVARGCSPTFVAKRKRFVKFQSFSEGLKSKAFPEDYRSFSPERKDETVKKLVDELVDELAAAMRQGPIQGVDIQADDSHTMQVGEGSTPQFDTTALMDVDMQVTNPDQMQFDEVRETAPNPDLGNTSSNDSSLQNVAWNQCDNSQGHPPSRPPVWLEETVLFLSDIYRRASRFPEWLPKFEWSEEEFRSFHRQLETLEGALADDSNPHKRSREEEFLPPIDEYPQTGTSMLEADKFWRDFLSSPQA